MRKILLFLYTEDGGDQGDRGDHHFNPPLHKIFHGGDQGDLLGLLGGLFHGGGGKWWSPRSPWSPPSLVYKYNNIFLISIEITIVNSPRRPRRPKGDDNLEKIHGGDQGDQGDLLGLLRGLFCGGGVKDGLLGLLGLLRLLDIKIMVFSLFKLKLQ